jgi:hypothetical protein
MTETLKLFDPVPDNHRLVGLRVVMPTPCPHCQGTEATVGTGSGPHRTALMCICGRRCGGMDIESFNFISETVSRFGRPTEPIVVRPPRDSGGVDVCPSLQTHRRPEMATANDFFPSNYLRASDLAGQERIVTIDCVKSDVFENDGKKQTKPIIYFRDAGVKPLVLNKTNFLLIAAACGENTDAWPGKRIVLYPDMVSFKGQVQEAIRVRRYVQPAVSAPASHELSDSIPR